ncbi:hypothetical protein WDZ92_23655 [Nostoc sp. NIES-2111]
MVRRCVYSGVLQEGQTERPSWVIPDTPGDAGADQCLSSGGTIVEDGKRPKCSCTSATVQRWSADGRTGQALSNAVLDPVRRVRDTFQHTHFVQALVEVNDSDEMVEIVTSHPDIALRLAEGVGFLSSVCTAALAEREDDPVLQLQYDESFHGWITALAEEVRAKLPGGNLVAALDQAVGQLETYVGRSFGDVAADLRRQVATTA